MNTCYILASSGFTKREAAAIRRERGPQDLLICADGGFDHAVRYGLTPDLIMGDFDSVKNRDFGGVPVKQFPAHKDDTDTGIAIAEGELRGYRRFVLYGCLGGRLDHTVANLSQMAGLAQRGCACELRSARNEAHILRDGVLRLPARRGCKLSVFALFGEARGVTLEQVEYPLKNATLTPGYPLGVSNEFQKGEAVIRVEEGTLLVILSKD